MVDFDQVELWQDQLTGDDLFSALGTTLNIAGSQTAQYLVDYTYQLNVASAAAANGVARFYLVSSPGADPNSRMFYTRMKGELDRDVSALNFEFIALIKPLLIRGERPDSRPMEALGEYVFKLTSYLPGLSAYRPLQGRELGEAIVRYAAANTKQPPAEKVLSMEMKQLADWL